MNKTLKKILVLFAFTFLLICIDKKVFATSISFSPNNPKVNQSVTITVSVPNVHTASVYANVTGPGISTQIAVVGGDLGGNKQTISKSITVKPTGTGKISVSIASNSRAIADGKDVNVQASASATVTEATTGNSNSGGGNSGGTSNSGGGSTTNNTSTAEPSLGNLGITPHDFSGFKSTKTSYTVNVPNDCTSIKIYATAKVGKITSGTGTKNLKEGTNKFSVVVANGNKTKTYTISVIRATSTDAEEVPNVIEEQDEQEPVEENPGIGLAKLEIPGYELDKEFATDVYEYTVTTEEELTLEELEEIKDKIIAESNFEAAVFEANAEITEDGVRQIVIIVKDDEREYAKYIITFEVEEKEEVVAGVVTDDTSTDPGNGQTGLSMKDRIYILAGLVGIISCVTIVLSINSYIQTRRLREYEGDYDEYDDETDFDQVNQYDEEIQGENSELEELEKLQQPPQRTDEILDPTQDFGEITTEIISKSQQLNGYRNLRGQRKPTGGRHF